MAHAGPEPGIPQQEGWIQGKIPGWIQAAVNTCKAWKQAALNSPFIIAFFLAFSPFILIFIIFMLPLFIILICALSTALFCIITVCFFFACGLPVYFFTVAYGFLFMMFVTWRLEPHRIVTAELREGSVKYSPSTSTRTMVVKFYGTTSKIKCEDL